MTTVEEHAKWLQQYAQEIIVNWDDEGYWTAEATLKNQYSPGKLHTCLSSGFDNIAEATRELCDKVCEFLGDKCE